jgi:hypothetical protein
MAGTTTATVPGALKRPHLKFFFCVVLCVKQAASQVVRVAVPTSGHTPHHAPRPITAQSPWIARAVACFTRTNSFVSIPSLLPRYWWRRRPSHPSARAVVSQPRRLPFANSHSNHHRATALNDPARCSPSPPSPSSSSSSSAASFSTPTPRKSSLPLTTSSPPNHAPRSAAEIW